jgi:succinoglycan biosynthesis protein ExoV
VQIFYHRMKDGNVGDDLNGLLWRSLLPNIADIHADKWLVGIGTIIDGRINQLSGLKVVMGSGYRPNSTPIELDASIEFAAVRGLGTAQRLGLPAGVAVCDPGFLLTELFGRSAPGSGLGLVPHVYSERWSHIASAADDAGLDVISPTLPVDAFVKRLQACSRVFCESMHAAIFADALRIPWARVKISSHHLEGDGVADFKWDDAFSVLGLSTESAAQSCLHRPIRRRAWLRQLVGPLYRRRERTLALELKSKGDDSRLFKLSEEARLASLTSELLNRVQRLAAH